MLVLTGSLTSAACQPWPLARHQGSHRACQAARLRVQAISVLPFIGGSAGSTDAAAADDSVAVTAARPPSSSALPSEEAVELRSQIEELKER